jgi:anti-sigma regulatory factor (Ser/Thr protein kinase)
MGLPPDSGRAATASLELVLPASPHSVSEIRHAVTEFVSGYEQETVDAVRLALSEACANVVLHAYPATQGPIEVDVTRGAGAIRIVVRDHGRGLGQDSPRAQLGLGLVVMQRLCTSCTLHEPRGGGTEVRMTFAAREADPVA